MTKFMLCYVLPSFIVIKTVFSFITLQGSHIGAETHETVTVVTMCF